MYQSQTSTIFVADLPVSKDSCGQPVAQIDNELLMEIFDERYFYFIEIEHISIKTNIGWDGEPHAYAYVTFEDHNDAMKAIADLNYTKINNVPIRLMPADKETEKIIHSNKGNIFVGNLDPDIEESQLDDAFSNFGEIISCKIPTEIQIITKPDGTKEEENVSRGYGYIQFRNPDDAKQAILDLKNASINGRPVDIQPFCHRLKNPDATFNNCYIKNLPPNYTDRELRKLFSEFGTPLSWRVITNKKGKSKLFGYCCMDSHENAVKAVEGLTGRVIDGSILVCYRYKSKQERQKIKQFKSEKREKAIQDRKRRIQIESDKCKDRVLFVKNFDESVTDEELKKVFSQFGTISWAKIIRDREGNSNKYAFICFETMQQAYKCLENSPLVQIHDKQCFVEPAKT